MIVSVNTYKQPIPCFAISLCYLFAGMVYVCSRNNHRFIRPIVGGWGAEVERIIIDQQQSNYYCHPIVFIFRPNGLLHYYLMMLADLYVSNQSRHTFVFSLKLICSTCL